jgi:predicted aspartyl protease
MRAYVILAGVLSAVAAPPAVEGAETSALEVENVVYTSLPIEASVEFNHGMPLVKVMVNDEGPFTFLIDTGAGATLVATSLAERLGLEATGTNEIGDPTDPEAVKVNRFELTTLTLGDVRFETVGVTELPDEIGHGMFDGVIGLGLVRDFTFTLDYTENELRLSEDGLTDGDGSIEYRLGDDNLVLLDVALGDAQIECHLDTGSMAPLMVPTRYLEGVTLAGELRTLGYAQTVNQTFELKGARVEDNVSIAGLNLRASESGY